MTKAQANGWNKQIPPPPLCEHPIEKLRYLAHVDRGHYHGVPRKDILTTMLIDPPMRTIFVGLILAATLVGCAITAEMRAREDMEQSKAAYKQCLGQYSQDPNHCEALKRAYEADITAYRATSGLRPGAVIDVQESTK